MCDQAQDRLAVLRRDSGLFNHANRDEPYRQIPRGRTDYASICAPREPALEGWLRAASKGREIGTQIRTARLARAVLKAFGIEYGRRRRSASGVRVPRCKQVPDGRA